MGEKNKNGGWKHSVVVGVEVKDDYVEIKRVVYEEKPRLSKAEKEHNSKGVRIFANGDRIMMEHPSKDTYKASPYIAKVKGILASGSLLEIQRLYQEVDEMVDLTDEATSVYTEKEDNNPCYVYFASDMAGESASVLIKFKKAVELKKYFALLTEKTLNHVEMDMEHNAKELTDVYKLMLHGYSGIVIEGKLKYDGVLFDYVMRLER